KPFQRRRVTMAVDAKQIQEVVKAIKDALGPKNEIIEGIKIFVWPFVVGAGLWFFRQPLARFLEGLGQRATKFSAFNISIELTAVTSPPLSIPDLGPAVQGEDLVNGGHVYPTTIDALLSRVQEDAPPSYLLVDIGNGKRWLVSRLLLFTFVL